MGKYSRSSLVRITSGEPPFTQSCSTCRPYSSHGYQDSELGRQHPEPALLSFRWKHSLGHRPCLWSVETETPPRESRSTQASQSSTVGSSVSPFHCALFFRSVMRLMKRLIIAQLG